MAKNIIILNRGDSYDFNLVINDENTADKIYHFYEGDVLYFGVMDPNQPFEHALIKKRFELGDGITSENTVSITIDPEDTLDLIPGKYYYAIKLKMDHYEVDGTGEILHVEGVKTVINKTKFILCD